MASEIRVNSLSSRTGLSTVTFTDTGPIFSGITTFQDNSGFNVGTGGSIFSPASNTVTLGTNNAERLRIDSSGRLQVGTTTNIIWNQTSEDGVVIEQSGATQIVRSNDVPLLVTRNTSTGQIAKFSQAGTERGAIVYDGVFGIASASDLSFDTNSSERLRITSAGSIGIGTDDPRYPLEVNSGNLLVSGSAAGNLILEDRSVGDSSRPFALLASNDGNFTITNANRNASGTTTSSAERLRITGSGYVGIGSDNPTGRLDIQDNFENRFAIRFVNTMGTGRTYGFRSHGSNGEALTLYHGSIRLQQWDDYQAGGNTVFYSGGNESFRINSNGDVQARRARSNTAGDVALSIQPSDTTIHYGFRIDQANNNLNLDRVGTGNFVSITAGGDLLLGGQTAYTYDDTGASNTILDIANSNNNKRGILSLSGNSNANGPSIGTIWFNNDQNSGTGPGGTMKLVAAIQAKAVTSDSNAGDDSGAYLQFLTKPESAALAESMVIHSDGEVTKVKQPGFFARRSIAGDGRAAAAQEWTVTGTGSFNTGNHFNTSNGRFTAPVAGRYIFTAAPGYKQTSYDYNFKFLINGGQQSEPVRIIDGGDDLTSHSGFTGTVIYNLNANDYVQVEVGYIHHVNLTYNFFMGYLLG